MYIDINVSSENFKSESFIKGLEEGTHSTAAQRKMHIAKKVDGNRFLSSEVKLTICFHILTGSSYLDLSLIFDM